MKKEYVMGNGAIALGALAAGVNLAAGYPGTPSSEIIETLAKRTGGQKGGSAQAGAADDSAQAGGLHLEWSVNEKAAMEVACSAAYSGARSLVTMKQMGLNVAADPFMSVAYVGVKGGMVVVAADDPGPISSQTEQDTRRFGEFARVPVLDPASPEEAYEMVQDAFACSEKYGTPVLLRPTTRVCHAYGAVELAEACDVEDCEAKGCEANGYQPKDYEGFVKDSGRWVIFPKLANANHGIIEARNVEIGKDFSSYKFNTVRGSSAKAVLAGGVSYAYAKEFMKDYPELRLIRVATPYPFPEDFMLEALEGVEEVLCFEELSPFLEEKLLQLIGKHGLGIKVHGKMDGSAPVCGENSADIAASAIGDFYGLEVAGTTDYSDKPALPVRPPVLCAGCPHRGAFYAVKKAMEGKRAYFCGDIGCYTLGNAMPLDMVDTCLCMGAGVTMAQGFNWVDREGTAFAFIGDSTFFASGITGVVNAVYNGADMILCVLDNSTTAMTGHQPHPGTGRTVAGEIAPVISIEKVLEGVGVSKILTVDPLDFESSVAAVRECAAVAGVKAIIFKSPCIALTKPAGKCAVGEACVNCKNCIKEIGCPALITACGQVTIDKNLCTGCGLCKAVCPVDAIGGGADE